MNRIRWNWEINLGHLLMVIALVGSVMTTWRVFESKLIAVEIRQADDRDTLKRLVDATERIMQNQSRVAALLDGHLGALREK